MAACFFQFSRPYNIVFLVKTGFQLYQNRNLFAILCRLGKRCDDRRIAADTIQCLLDSKHVRIYRSLPDKIDHRIKGLIRMMHQDIAFSDLCKNI